MLLGAFFWWERRVPEPMLDLGFFRSPSFSVGTAAVSVAFFALLGGIFALTQYLQFAHGFSAIEAGALMSPMALGLMVGAGSSSKAVHRLGLPRVVAAGLAGLALMLSLTTLWDPTTGSIVLAFWFFGLTLAMGWVMAPATDAVVGAVPAAKTGVASATNTVARMVSGALGVAIIGSLIGSIYARDVEGSLVGLPAEAQAGAEDSVGAAAAVAAQLPADAASELRSHDRRGVHTRDGARPARGGGARRGHGGRGRPFPPGARTRGGEGGGDREPALQPIVGPG